MESQRAHRTPENRTYPVANLVPGKVSHLQGLPSGGASRSSETMRGQFDRGKIIFLEGFWDVTCDLELAGEFGNESIIRLPCVEVLKLSRACRSIISLHFIFCL